jgi:hypothetical protein
MSSSSTGDFVSKALDWLKGASMDDALDFYDDLYHTPGCGDEELAAIGAGDRFFLLTHLLKRLDIIHPWLYARCREVEAAPNEFLDLWARDHRKSTIITYAGSIQEILNNQEITIGLFSHTRPIAKAFLTQIKREFESNKNLVALYPSILWDNPVKDAPVWSIETGITVKRQSNPKEATIEAWGLVDGQPTSKHYQLRIYDDVVTRESVTTPEQVQKTTEAWELSDNLGTADGRRWTIGTRYSFADTYGAILERKALQPRIYPATDNGHEDGNPVLLTPAQWAKKKIDQGPQTIACQQLQNPIAGQQAMFDVTDLQEFEVRPATLNIYILVDPARSMKKGSANTAIAVIGIDSARNKYLLDGVNHRMNLSDRWAAVKDMRRIWLNQPGVQMISVGYEAFGAQADLDYFYERMEVETNSFPIVELKWPRDGEGSKDDRVQRLGPDFRSHKFFVPKDCPQLTSHQSVVKDAGQPYRIAKPIRKKDSDGNIYDLTRQFKEQVMFYPFAPLKDLIDAASRVYDLDPRPPVLIEDGALEPEHYADS